jgi:hypothetical protein
VIGHDSVPFQPGGGRAIKAPSSGRKIVLYGGSDGRAGGDPSIIAQMPHAGSTPLEPPWSALTATDLHRSARSISFPEPITIFDIIGKYCPFLPFLASFREKLLDLTLIPPRTIGKYYPDFLFLASFSEFPLLEAQEMFDLTISVRPDLGISRRVESPWKKYRTSRMSWRTGRSDF